MNRLKYFAVAFVGLSFFYAHAVPLSLSENEIEETVDFEEVDETINEDGSSGMVGQVRSGFFVPVIEVPEGVFDLIQNEVEEPEDPVLTEEEQVEQARQDNFQNWAIAAQSRAMRHDQRAILFVFGSFVPYYSHEDVPRTDRKSLGGGVGFGVLRTIDYPGKKVDFNAHIEDQMSIGIANHIETTPNEIKKDSVGFLFSNYGRFSFRLTPAKVVSGWTGTGGFHLTKILSWRGGKKTKGAGGISAQAMAWGGPALKRPKVHFAFGPQIGALIISDHHGNRFGDLGVGGRIQAGGELWNVSGSVAQNMMQNTSKSPTDKKFTHVNAIVHGYWFVMSKKQLKKMKTRLKSRQVFPWMSISLGVDHLKLEKDGKSSDLQDDGSLRPDLIQTVQGMIHFGVGL
ncbi:MAG: hypothetical protein CL678_10030 [Bdellovibrionaceae bacterium]|nr:hypothetical protein [Pseudobdellovibrionaceae bacterium]